MTIYFDRFSKRIRFADLIETAQRCTLCERLCSKKKVLSEANGNIDTKVLFIAEAPGRLGADRTGIPLFGDRTGDNFEILLQNVGWKRNQIFITNAVLCNPLDENGTNGTPTKEEIANCSAYLEMVIKLIRPEVIVSLGATALKALEILEPHGLQLRNNVAQLTAWYGTKLFPLYHPGPRAILHRSLANQRADFMNLAKLVNPLKGLIIRENKKTILPIFPTETAKPIYHLIMALLELGNCLPYFKLTKLLYLLDFNAYKRYGSTIGCELYLRQVNGPWPPILDNILKSMEGYEVKRFYIGKTPMISFGPTPRYTIDLDEKTLNLIAEIWEKYGQLDNSRIKTAVYSTTPMRYILKQERLGKDMRNKPVIYNDKTALDLLLSQ